MPSDETGPPRKPRPTRTPPAFADDRPLVAPPAAARDEAPPPPAGERQRIAKAMARAGLCSRREAEAWIADGRVSVNGERLSSPARDVGPDDRVEVDGTPLPTLERTRLFLFHKPRGLVTSNHDPEGRPTVADHLREHWPQGPRVVTVGRLDINTEGLLLLTNDGGLARVLELPKTGWLRRYRVRANGTTDQARLDALGAGLTLDGVAYAGIEATLDRTQGANCWLTMGLREGKNREIKRVLEHLGLEVNRLIRLSFGPFQLLDLPEGAVEEVKTRVLRDQLGPVLADEAGAVFADEPAPQTSPVVRPEAQRKTITRETNTRETGSRETGTREERLRAPAGTPPRKPRPPARRGSDTAGERPMRRRSSPSPSAEREERPQGRPRRHVSTLRTSEADATRAGPRKRIERTDTRDRHDRAIAVERKVAARPAGLSPSAAGKRARIARSGGGRGPAAANGREPSRDARSRFRPAGGEERKTPSRAPAGAERDARRGRGGAERSGPRDAGGANRPDGRAPRSAEGSARLGARSDEAHVAKGFRKPARAGNAPKRREVDGARGGSGPARTGRERPQRFVRGEGAEGRRSGGMGAAGGRAGANGSAFGGKGRPSGGTRSGGSASGGTGSGGGSRSGGNSRSSSDTRPSGDRPPRRPTGGKPPRGGAPTRPKR